MEEEENNLFFYLDEKNQALPLNELPVSQNKGPSIQGEILPNFFYTQFDELFLVSFIVIVWLLIIEVVFFRSSNWYASRRC